MLESREQLQEILKKTNQYARSIYYIKNNKRIREDAAGNQFEIRFDTTGKRQEYKYHEWKKL